MTRQRFIVIAAMGVVLAATVGCANVPRSFDTSPGVVELRRDYVAAHPDGEWKTLVQRGEVARGMGFGEVFASWGMPVARVQEQDGRGDSVEYWGYADRDELSGDWSIYTFVFEKNVLVSWNVERHVAKNVSLTPDNLLDYTPARLVDPRAGRGRAVSARK